MAKIERASGIEFALVSGNGIDLVLDDDSPQVEIDDDLATKVLEENPAVVVVADHAEVPPVGLFGEN